MSFNCRSPYPLTTADLAAELGIGLLHRSQIPHGIDLTVGDVIEVEILSVDRDRGRIGLGWVES